MTVKPVNTEADWEEMCARKVKNMKHTHTTQTPHNTTQTLGRDVCAKRYRYETQHTAHNTTQHSTNTNTGRRCVRRYETQTHSTIKTQDWDEMCARKVKDMKLIQSKKLTQIEYD